MSGPKDSVPRPLHLAQGLKFTRCGIDRNSVDGPAHVSADRDFFRRVLEGRPSGTDGEQKYTACRSCTRALDGGPTAAEELRDASPFGRPFEVGQTFCDFCDEAEVVVQLEDEKVSICAGCAAFAIRALAASTAFQAPQVEPPASGEGDPR